MPTLPDLQHGMAAVVRGDASADAMRGVLAPLPGGDAAARLSIHRNTLTHGLRDALAATYPVIAELVGDDFFARVARDFGAVHPPRQGPLLDWGEAFAGFLDAYQPADMLPYLGDVARLEWALHEAFHAADATPLDLAGLRTVPMEMMGGVVFRVHPAARIVGSVWPIHTIWSVHQDEGAADGSVVDLDAGGECVLITRPGRDVIVRRMDLGGFVFFTHLHRGETVAASFSAALAVDPAFDLAGGLQIFLESGAFRRFHVLDKETVL